MPICHVPICLTAVTIILVHKIPRIAELNDCKVQTCPSYNTSVVIGSPVSALRWPTLSPPQTHLWTKCTVHLQSQHVCRWSSKYDSSLHSAEPGLWRNLSQNPVCGLKLHLQYYSSGPAKEKKLLQLSVPYCTCRWITDSLTEGKQHMKLWKQVFHCRTSTTVYPQACTLSLRSISLRMLQPFTINH